MQNNNERVLNIFSIENSGNDLFCPHSIRVDYPQSVPFKETNQSLQSYGSSLQQDIIQIQQSQNMPRMSVFQKGGVVMNSQKMKLFLKKNNEKSKYTSSLQQKQQPQFFKLIQRQAFVRKFLENLKRLAYIFPAILAEQNNNLLKETYLMEENEKFHSQQKEKVIETSCIITLDPFGIFSITINIFKSILYLLLMWWFLFKAAFQIDIQILADMENILIYIFILDVVLKLNQSQIIDGTLINDRKIILKQYLTKEVLFDVLYIGSQQLLIQRYLRQVFILEELMSLLQFFMNFHKLKDKIIKLEEMFTTSANQIEISSLLQLMLLVICFAHLMACIWYYVGRESLNIFNNSWITNLNNYDELQLIDLYILSFYWATVTMVTVGYGDIVPKNQMEYICAIMLVIFSTGIFAFLINQIGQIFSSLDQEQQIYKKNLLIINQYMKQNNVDSNIQSKVRNYLKLEQKISDQVKQEQVDQIFTKLPAAIYEDVQKNIQAKMVSEIQFYSPNFSEIVTTQVAKQLQNKYFTKNEIIFHQKEKDDCSLYTVWKGEVIIVDLVSGKILATLKKGECFGEVEFLNSMERQYTAISKDLTQVLKMSRVKFEKIISQSQIDLEKFHSMQYNLLFKSINMITPCYFCQGNHTISQCRKLNYFPNIYKIVKDSNSSIQLNRQSFLRHGQKNKFIQVNTQNTDTQNQQSEEEYQQEHSFNQGQVSALSPSEKIIQYSKKTSLTNKKKDLTSKLIILQEEFSSKIIKNDQQQIGTQGTPKSVAKITYKKQGTQQKLISYVFDQLEFLEPKQLFIDVQIDKMQEYKIFNPQNNLDCILQQITKNQFKSKRLSIFDFIRDFSRQRDSLESSPMKS